MSDKLQQDHFKPVVFKVCRSLVEDESKWVGHPLNCNLHIVHLGWLTLAKNNLMISKK
jgi:hypothetical protein